MKRNLKASYRLRRNHDQDQHRIRLPRLKNVRINILNVALGDLALLILSKNISELPALIRKCFMSKCESISHSLCTPENEN